MRIKKLSGYRVVCYYQVYFYYNRQPDNFLHATITKKKDNPLELPFLYRKDVIS
jgi:hypothetical protein